MSSGQITLGATNLLGYTMLCLSRVQSNVQRGCVKLLNFHNLQFIKLETNQAIKMFHRTCSTLQKVGILEKIKHAKMYFL